MNGQPAKVTLDVKKTKVVKTWKASAPLMKCRFDPVKRFVFATSEDMTILRFNLADGKTTAFKGHESWIHGLGFLKQGELLVSTGSDDSMIFWKTAEEKPAPLKTIKAHKGWVRAVDINPAQTIIATGGNDHLVKLWNPDGSLVRELKGHESHIYSLLFHPTEDVLFSGDLQGKVLQWEVKTGKLMRTLEAKELHSYNGGQQVHYGGVRSLAFDQKTQRLLCAGLHKATNPLGAVNEPIVVSLDWKTGKKVRSQVVDGVRGIGWRVLVLADGTTICGSGGSGGGYVLYWKPEEEKAFFKYKLPNTIRDLDLHPDGTQIATAHHDRNLRISSIGTTT